MMTTVPARMLLVIVVLALALAACSGPTDAPSPPEATRPPSPQGDASTPDATTPDATKGGDGDRAREPADVLRFSAQRLGGGTIEGEDYSGSDVAFWFWAPW
jgi:hypothetical protein